METSITINGKTYDLDEAQIAKILSICNQPKALLSSLPIKDLRKKVFYVKDYQRGYRWTEDEIYSLLEDIEKIEDEEGYCMQPLIVKTLASAEDAKAKLDVEKCIAEGLYSLNSKTYELVDGQQRLTTLWLILAFLDYQEVDYSIYYELIRSVDKHYIENAFSLIKYWFTSKHAYNSNKTETGRNVKNTDGSLVWREDKKQEYKNKIGKLFFIWYEIKDNTPSERVFRSINEGKIELTNAELFKAILLNPDNIENYVGIEEPKVKQQQIAFEWDKLESKLKEDDFWYFISRENVEKSSQNTRIDYILELYARKINEVEGLGLNCEKDRFSFLTIQKYLAKYAKEKDFNTIIGIWEAIVEVFDKLYSWYSDEELYHTIGFITAISAKRAGSNSVVSEEIADLYQNICDLCLADVKKEVKRTISNRFISTDGNDIIIT